MLKKTILFAFTLAWLSCSRPSEETSGKWTPLFNGKDLTGWTVKMGGRELNEDIENTYTVSQGVLRVYDQKRDRGVRVGHMFYKQQYSDFRLRFEYRFTGKQFAPDSTWPEQFGGIVFHAQSPESMGLKQDYPVCLEFQLLGGKDSGTRPTGNLCTIGTIVDTDGKTNPAHCINSSSPGFEGDRWVNAEMEVWGDSLVRHYINNRKVLEYTNLKIGGGFVSEGFDWVKGNVKDPEYWIAKDGTLLGTGYIGIQAHDPIEFRNMEIMPLDRK